MSQELVMEVARNAVFTIIITSAPLLGTGLIVGLVVSILQATTQIQEQTLAFIPKIVAILFSLVIFGKWILLYLLDFTNRIFEYMLHVVG